MANFPTEIDDRAVLFTLADLDRLRIEHPYRLRILTERDPSGGPGLLAHAKQSVDSRKTLVLAIDPQSKQVFFRVGADVGVRPGDFDAISAKGNTFFRNHAWVDGIEAILRAAEASQRTATTSTTTTSDLAASSSTSDGWPVPFVVALCLSIGILFVAIPLWWKRKQDEQSRLQALEAEAEFQMSMRRRTTSPPRSATLVMTQPTSARPYHNEAPAEPEPPAPARPAPAPSAVPLTPRPSPAPAYVPPRPIPRAEPAYAPRPAPAPSPPPAPRHVIHEHSYTSSVYDSTPSYHGGSSNSHSSSYDSGGSSSYDSGGSSSSFGDD